MVSIGDMKNNLRILQSEARIMKYTGDFDLDGLSKGNPQSLLPLYHHIFTMYNTQFTEEVLHTVKDVLCTKSDVRFMESVYKILRDIFNFKPSMTKEQFFTLNNFAERKVIMCIAVMRTVKQHCHFMGPRLPTNRHIKVTSIVDTGRNAKKPSTCEVTQSESGKLRKAPSSSLAIDEKGNWQTKQGYLRPLSAGDDEDVSAKSSLEHCLAAEVGDQWPAHPEEEEGGGKKLARKEGRESAGSRKLLRKEDRQLASKSGEHQGPVAKFRSAFQKQPQADTVQMPHVAGKRPESGGTRASEAAPALSQDSGMEHGVEWDPSEAVETILAKVRDLPSQLTSFMKAVESRLIRLEDRLEKVETVVSRFSHWERKSPNSFPESKKEMDMLQARITLLENRVTLNENKPPNAGGEQTVQSQATEEKRMDIGQNPFVSLERGDRGIEHLQSNLSDDSFTRDLGHASFSPICSGDVEVVDIFASPNDTTASLRDSAANKRHSSTPNHSALASGKPGSEIPSRAADQGGSQKAIGHSHGRGESVVCGRKKGEEAKGKVGRDACCEEGTGDCVAGLKSQGCLDEGRECGAGGLGDQANLSTSCVSLDCDTMQQVHRIKQLFRATEMLLPSSESSADS